MLRLDPKFNTKFNRPHVAADPYVNPWYIKVCRRITEKRC
mgnify:CR=1 FL=1